MANPTKAVKAKKRPTRKRGKAAGTKIPAVKLTGFPTDAESVLLRQVEAEKTKAPVERCLGTGRAAFYGTFDVASAQWDQPYRVEIRDLSEPVNSCSCQDYRMNGLGTCKHIERTLQFLAHRRLRLFKEAARSGADAYEIFFDTRQTPPVLRLRRPMQRNAKLDALMRPLFDEEGIPLGANAEVWLALEAIAAGLNAQRRSLIRLSAHAPYWLERERRADLLRQLRRRFEADVAAGRRSDNPVRLPLYPYQKQGMLHLAFKGRALLADDMGLGKTVQAIAAAELLRSLDLVRRVLVVSPASLKTEWEEQLAHFTGIVATPVFGSRATRLRNYAGDNPYTLCNYEQIRGDVDEINRLMVPDLVILDEAQRIKNWPTRTAKTIKRLQSPFAFVLTGTPLENRIEELYSLVEFVDPHVFGSLFRFQRDYLEISPEREIRPKRLDVLHRVVSSVMLRRRKSDVEDALPERSDKNYFVPMTSEQRARYSEIEYEVAKIVSILKRRPLRKEEFKRLQMLLACMRMLCDTPYILDAECRACPKLEELERILDDLLEDETAKVIIFSEWVRMLELVKERLDAKGIGYAEHTGKIPQQARRAQIRAFKDDPACRIFLSSDSGSTGLNLQVANVVINLDLPWNPARLEQRIARAWRKHQRRPVRVINLVTENSIEQGMIGKLAYKSALADAVLDGGGIPDSPTSESGRQAYANRVRSLLGGDATSEPEVRSVASVPSPTRPTKEKDSTAQFVARHAAAIMGIEHRPATGARLVMARPGADIGELQLAADAAAPGKTLVLTPDMRAALCRMQELGLLTLASDLDVLHAPEGYQPLRVAAPRVALRMVDAQKIWRSAELERKAARALNDLGLTAQAAPHLDAVLQAAREALRALYACEKDADLPDAAAPLHRKLERDLRDATSADLAAGLDLTDDLTRVLKD